MKLDLLTNSTMVDDAIRFVSDRSKEKPTHLESAVTKMTKKNQMSLMMKNLEKQVIQQ